MTIQDIIAIQKCGDDDIYLLPQGAFYHAYEDGARALASFMGYKLREGTYGRHQTPYTFCGFPISSLDRVLVKIATSCTNCSVYMDKCGTAVVIKIERLS